MAGVCFASYTAHTTVCFSSDYNLGAIVKCLQIHWQRHIVLWKDSGRSVAFCESCIPPSISTTQTKAEQQSEMSDYFLDWSDSGHAELISPSKIYRLQFCASGSKTKSAAKHTDGPATSAATLTSCSLQWEQTSFTLFPLLSFKRCLVAKWTEKPLCLDTSQHVLPRNSQPILESHPKAP